MKCVACKQLMIVLELDRVEVDYCLDCGGTWLDSGELELLLEDPQAVKQIMDKVKSEGQKDQSGPKCPICYKRMEELAIGSESSVHIDLCRRGHGIWFDRGELKAIVEILGGVVNNKVADLLRDIFGEKQSQT